jgi:NADH:ubiquinone oxidoreductase subunit 4 (subunit M)
LLIAVAALVHGVSGLRLIQRIVWGAKGATAPMDMRWREMALVVPLLLCALALGLKPGPVLDRVGGSIDQVLAVAAPAATAGEGE